jgi:hypothetical protein
VRTARSLDRSRARKRYRITRSNAEHTRARTSARQGRATRRRVRVRTPTRARSGRRVPGANYKRDTRPASLRRVTKCARYAMITAATPHRLRASRNAGRGTRAVDARAMHARASAPCEVYSSVLVFSLLFIDRVRSRVVSHGVSLILRTAAAARSRGIAIEIYDGQSVGLSSDRTTDRKMHLNNARNARACPPMSREERIAAPGD